MTAALACPPIDEALDFSLVYEIVPPRSALARLPSVIVEIVKLFDGSRSAEEVVDSAQISETKTRAVVRKLTRMGIIRPVSGETDGSQRGDFSPQERAFFEAELAPIDECDLPFESLSEKLRRKATRLARRITRS